MAMNDVECCDFYQVHEDVVKAVTAKMPDEDELYDLAEIFKVFGDSTRIKILYVLFESEMCVCESVSYFPSAEDPQAEPPGKEPQGRQSCILLPGRRTCKDHYQPGSGTH